MRLWIGCVDFKKGLYYETCSKDSLLRNMVITDEYLDYLGDQFQKTVCRNVMSWTFDSWICEVIGMDITSSKWDEVKLGSLPYANEKKKK